MTRLDLVETLVELPGRTLSVLRPRDAEALIDERAFERDEFLPYWAELWPSGLALARHVCGRQVRGLRVLELGCGLAVPSLAAAAGGARVVATDWSRDAVALVRRNAERNGVELDARACSWAAPPPLGELDLVLAADVLYERRNADVLLSLLRELAAPEVLVADPGRPYAAAFLRLAALDWEVQRILDPALPRGALYALRRLC
jgi:predicted nicotinamide N-methyase